MSYYYTNAAGQRFPWPERPLDPPDCLDEILEEPEEEEYDRAEDEMSEKWRRT